MRANDAEPAMALHISLPQEGEKKAGQALLAERAAAAAGGAADTPQA